MNKKKWIVIGGAASAFALAPLAAAAGPSLFDQPMSGSGVVVAAATTGPPADPSDPSGPAEPSASGGLEARGVTVTHGATLAVHFRSITPRGGDGKRMTMMRPGVRFVPGGRRLCRRDGKGVRAGT